MWVAEIGQDVYGPFESADAARQWAGINFPRAAMFSDPAKPLQSPDLLRQQQGVARILNRPDRRGQ